MLRRRRRHDATMLLFHMHPDFASVGRDEAAIGIRALVGLLVQMDSINVISLSDRTVESLRTIITCKMERLFGMNNLDMSSHQAGVLEHRLALGILALDVLDHATGVNVQDMFLHVTSVIEAFAALLTHEGRLLFVNSGNVFIQGCVRVERSFALIALHLVTNVVNTSFVVP